jgi:hypothetical protein
MALLRKRPAPVEEEPQTSDVVLEKPGGKNRPTPKRKEAQANRRKQSVLAGDPKELRQRQRQERRAKTQQYRAAMMSGDVDRLPPRERQPERVLVRDLVDNRRNFGPVFLAIFALYFVGGLIPVYAITALVFLLMLVGMLVFIADSFLVARTARQAVEAKYPNSNVAVRMYAVQRALMPGRWRMPRPRRPAAGYILPALRRR